MAIEAPDDLAVFFDPEEFGEAAVYFDGTESVDIVVIRDQESEAGGQFGRPTVSDTNHFLMRCADVATPLRGARINIAATGESFRINGAPIRDREGATWRCPAEPA